MARAATKRAKGTTAAFVLFVSLAVQPMRGSTGAPPAPLEAARLLASRYPENVAMSYIPALAWSSAIRLTELTGETRWKERAREQMRRLGGALAPTGGLAAIAGHMALFDAGDAHAARRAADFILPVERGASVRFARGWTDDMFFATALLARVASDVPGGAYARAAGRLLIDYASRLQRPDGLFNHAADAPHAWGRGNGFAALATVEALTYLPDRWTDRPRVLEVYRRHVRALAQHQADDGAWRQVVDDPGSYRELTVTAMTVAAMARGMRLGWIGREFDSNVDRGWTAVAGRIGADGTLRDVCAGTPAGATREHYLDRPRIDGADDRGGAMALLAAMEVELYKRGLLK